MLIEVEEEEVPCITYLVLHPSGYIESEFVRARAPCPVLWVVASITRRQSLQRRNLRLMFRGW